MMATATEGSPADRWESLPGWTPVYLGLSRFSLGLTLRLILTVVAAMAVALALGHGPPAFLKACLALEPTLALITSGIMLTGALEVSRGQPRAGAGPTARAAAAAIGVLMLLELVQIVLVLTAFAHGLPSAGRIALLSHLKFAGWLVGLGSLGIFVVSIGRIAAFTAALPSLSRARHVLLTAILLAPALVAYKIVAPALAGIGGGLDVLVGALLLGVGVLIMAGAIQLASSVRDSLHLTTAEFAAVAVPRRR